MTGRTGRFVHADYLQLSDQSQPEIDLKQSPLVLLAQTCSAIGNDCRNVVGGGSGGRIKPVSLKSYGSGNLDETLMRKEAKSKSPFSNNNFSTSSSSSSCSNGEVATKQQLLSPRRSVDARSPLDLKSHKSSQKRGHQSPPVGHGQLSPVKKQRISSPLPTPARDQKPSKYELVGGLADVGESKPKLNRNTKDDSGGKPLAQQQKPATSTAAFNSGLQQSTFAPATYSSALTPTTQAALSLYDQNLQMERAAASLFSLQNPSVSYYMQMMMMEAATRREASLTPSVPTSVSSGGDLTPHVCNWNVGTSSCGQMFSTADELMVHLRSHTIQTSTPSPTSPYTMMPAGLDKMAGNPYAYLQQHAATLAAMSPAAHSQLAASMMTPSTSPLGQYTLNPFKQPSFNPLVSSFPMATGPSYCPPYGLYGHATARFNGFGYH